MIVQLEKICKVWLFNMCVFRNLLLFIYYVGLFWKGWGALVILLYVNLSRIL